VIVTAKLPSVADKAGLNASQMAFLGIKVAATVVRAQVLTKTLNQGAGTKAVEDQLIAQMNNMKLQHPNLTADEEFRIGIMAKN